MLYRVSQTISWQDLNRGKIELIEAGAWILFGQTDAIIELLVKADSSAEALSMARNLDKGFDTIHFVTDILGAE